MEEIRRQVGRAQRILNLQSFLQLAAWSLFAAFIISLIAIAIPKIWAVEFLTDPQKAMIWNVSWLGGSAVLAMIFAGLYTYFHRANDVQTAIQVDREFGLRERVSSAMALESSSIDTDAGKALVNDAVSRVDGIDISEKFGLRFHWRALVPFVLLLGAIGVGFGFSNAKMDPQEVVENDEDKELEKKKIDETEKALKKKIRQKLKDAQQKGLEEARIAFKQIENITDDFDPKDKSSTKKMMSKLNDIKKQLEDRQKQIGDAKEMKKQLSRMKDVNDGPGDKVADSLKKGDFGKAKDELQKLADKLSSEGLSEEEKQQLSKQMQNLSEKLQNVADKAQQQKEQLQKEMQQAMNEGNMDKAAQMKEALDQMERQQKQMDQLSNLSQQLAQASQAMQKSQQSGDPSESQQQMAEAQQALQEMADQLSQMQQDAESMEMIEDVMDQIAQCKGMLSDMEGEGGAMDSDFDSLAGNGMGEGEGEGNGLGEGSGFGSRPENESKTGTYLAKVKGKTKAGEAVKSGKVGGPNISGVSALSVREQIASSNAEEADPQTDLKLPRSQREHAKEYFQNVNQSGN